MNYQDLMNLENIYLHSIEEPEENHLSLIFEKTKINTNTETLQTGNTIIEGLHSIDVDYKLPFIQLDFQWYIGYAITNESYTSFDEYERFDGRIFRIYSKSRYLDYINLSTVVTDEYPGTFKHYGVICLNHIVNVVSVEEPLVREIERKNNKLIK